MGYRLDDLAPGEVYHICTRGVEQRDIFLDVADRKRFLILLLHCLPQGQVRSLSLIQDREYKPKITKPQEGLVDLLAYCLMTNHFHLLIKENIEKGTSLYMKRILTSYACYFNKRRKRSGSLFIHPFKAVLVDGDDQLLHVSRYIHLNPYMANMVNDIFTYPWSSLNQYTQSRVVESTCHCNLLRGLMSSRDYIAFVADEANYGRSIAEVQHLLIDYKDKRP